MGKVFMLHDNVFHTDTEGRMCCLKTLFRRHHFQRSGGDLNLSSSSCHTLILFTDCIFNTIVVLVVILITQDTLKISELNRTELTTDTLNAIADKLYKFKLIITILLLLILSTTLLLLLLLIIIIII